jgi:diguanylate cyclase (GGDEF)-like protein
MYSMDKAAERVSLIIKSYETIDKKLYLDAIETQKRSLKIIDASMIIGAVGVLIIAAFFIFYIDWSIRVPIERLSRGVRDLDLLKWQKITIEDTSEIGKFANEYNKMVDKLKLAYENLEGKVLDRTAELKEANDKLQILATTDGLTGAYNQRFFYERLESELERAERYSHPLSLMIADVDDFKHYNDKNGHLAGDKVLRGIAECFRKGIRNVDFFARYGGEEFVVLMFETGLNEAEIIADRVRGIIESEPFPDKASQPLGKVTVSIGIASYSHGSDTPKNLVMKADQAMYRAKKLGKNRIEKEA